MDSIFANRTFKFWLLIGIPCLLIALAEFLLPGYYMRLIRLFGINVILVASLNLTNGFTGIFSLGHAGFMAVGAYLSAMLTVSPAAKATMMPDLPAWIAKAELPLPLTLPIAGAGALVVAFLIGFPVLRFKGHYLSVATLGLLVIIRAVLENNGGWTNGPRGITGLPSDSGTLLILSVMVATLYFLHRLTRSASGRSMTAVRDDITAAASLGVDPARTRLAAFCTSAFFAGIGGALWGHLMQVIAPQFFSFTQSFLLVETSIIGGMFSLSGAVIGSLIMTFVPEILSSLESGITIFGFSLPPLYGLAQLIFSAALIVLIILKPQGLSGYREYIVPALFDRHTYRAALDPDGYRHIAAWFRSIPGRRRARRSASGQKKLFRRRRN